MVIIMGQCQKSRIIQIMDLIQVPTSIVFEHHCNGRKKGLSYHYSGQDAQVLCGISTDIDMQGSLLPSREILTTFQLLIAHRGMDISLSQLRVGLQCFTQLFQQGQLLSHISFSLLCEWNRTVENTSILQGEAAQFCYI